MMRFKQFAPKLPRPGGERVGERGLLTQVELSNAVHPHPALSLEGEGACAEAAE